GPRRRSETTGSSGCRAATSRPSPGPTARRSSEWTGCGGGSSPAIPTSATPSPGSNKKAPAFARAPRIPGSEALVHAAHATGHSGGRRLLLLLDLGDESLGREHQSGHRRRVLQRVLGDLRRVDDSRLQHVLDLLTVRVEPVVAALGLELV